VSTVHPEPDWLTLDNAAKIYPSAISKLYPAVFRLSAVLRAQVRLSALQQASDALVRRCPYFQVYLRRGLFWYYLQRHHHTPRVQLLERSALQNLPARGKTEHLFRILTRDRTIAVDFSHILTDGYGGLRFLRSLLAEYLRLCGVKIKKHGELLDPREKPDPEEAEDGHRKHSNKGGPEPKRYAAAYHITGRPSQPGYFRTLTGRMPTSQMLSLSRAKGVTLTEYLAALYMYCLGQLYEVEARSGGRPGRSILRLEVPEEMTEHIDSFGFVLPPSQVRKKCCSVISYKDGLSVAISSVVESRELERLYFTTIVSQGVPVTVLED